jgi:hypothetical protein
MGDSALYHATANQNTAIGYDAAQNLSTGSGNVAIGYNSMQTNATGSNNIAIGNGADVGAGYSNATSIGYSASVGESNAIVLGGTGSNAVNVGIGTASPSRILDVAANNTQIAAPMALLEQSGTGDSSMEFKDPSNSVYIGQDASNSDALIVSSGTAATHNRAGAPYSLGYTSVAHSFNDSGNSGLISSMPFTTSLGGSLSQISVDFSAGAGDNFEVAIYADSGSNYPGTLLGTSPSTAISITGSDNWNTATLSSSVSLNPSTKYWLAYETQNGIANYWLDNTKGATCWQTIGGSGTFGTWAPVSSTSCDQGYTTNNTYGIYALVNPLGSSHSLTDTFSNPLMTMTQSGFTTFEGMSNSTTAFQVDNSSASAVLSVDTVNSRIGIDNSNPQYSLDVAGTERIQTTTNSTAAFGVQNSGGANLLTVDTSDNVIQIGSASSDNTAILLQLDRYNQVTDPAGTNGAMYYNTTLSRFRCYQDGWYDCIGISGDYQRQHPFYSTDFMGASTASQSPPWTGSNQTAGGSQSVFTNDITANHPGVVGLYNGSVANGGYRYLTSTGNTSFVFGGGETFETVFNSNYLTTSSIRMGFWDGSDATSAVANGAYVDINSSGVLTGKTARSSAGASTGTTYTTATSTWYHLKIVVNGNATQIDYYLYNDNGTQLWHDSLSTDIPTVSLNNGVSASCTDATDHNIVNMDYMSVWESNQLTR